MKKLQLVGAALLAGSTWLSGCADTGYGQPASKPSRQSEYSTTSQSQVTGHGVIEAIDIAPAASSSPLNAGTVVGGVVGGVLGNQIGGGSGRTAATVAGAVGGAMVGNKVEQNRTAGRQSYQIRVKLDNGAYQTVTQDEMGDLHVGNRVRIENNRVYRY
jgi:outer membrane lipoprotein SlyB